MAGVSELPFRVIALEMGAGLATTELISAAGIKFKNRRTRQYMTFDREKERPYSIQLFGGDPAVMAIAAAVSAEHGADIIDINMGCPVRKVTGSGAGSALSCDPARAAAMVEAMRRATDDKVPITAKIRTGWDDASINAPEMAKHLEGAGCAALAIHGRTRAAGYSGHADWTIFQKVKAVVKMPIIGNGDILSLADAKRMFDESGVDGVMIGRGALGNPWIFRGGKTLTDLPTPTPTERLALIRRHYQAHLAFHTSLDDDDAKKLLRTPPEVMAIKTFRQHLVWYSRGLTGAKDFRKGVLTEESPEIVLAAIEKFFAVADAEGLGSNVAAYDEAEGDADGVNYKQAFG